MVLEKRVYTSSNYYSFYSILKESLSGYKNSFYLAKQLAIRDVNAQYRQSIFGFFWAISPIIINSALWVFLQASGIVQITETKIPYPLFVVLGSTLWGIISECINLPMVSINSNRGLISKINFDKEALITLGLIKLIVNFLLKIIVVLFFMIYFQVVPSIHFLWFFPLVFCSMIFFVSLGIFIAPIGLLFNDVSRFISLFMQFLMYVTPVVYVIPKSGLMKTIMFYNPLTYWMTDLKNSMTGFSIENTFFWIVFLIVTILFTAMALVVYRVSMPIITERMS